MSSQNFQLLRIALDGKIVLLNGYECFIKVRPYNSGRIYMTLHDLKDGQQVARVTLDIDDIPHIDHLIIVKSYAENKGMYEALIEANIIEECTRKYAVGFEFAHVCFLKLPLNTTLN